ncbi:hypothetical protein Bca101_027157 [Brassica carinata]
MNVDPEYWETGETEGCDDIINLSSDLNFEDDLSPLCDNDVVDIDGSSTGSTPIGYDVNRDTEMRSGYIRNGKERRRIVRSGNEEVGNPIEYINTESEAERSDSLGRKNSHGNAEDICSGIRGSNGLKQHNTDVVYIGMVFRSRDEFKQHLAIYAIRNKFRFRTTRSAPGGMVLRCFSRSCNWRVYAVNLKNTELFEVRKVYLHHSCSVDDRSGYQSQATHAVIGEMTKAKFSGRGGGPRPNEIIQAMRGDHDVHISYWKAWRSREVALDYAKGLAGASYNLLPLYLENLVAANPGTIAEIHTEHSDGVGDRFKYMFLALGGSIEGFKFMRKVVIVDGTHFRGNYAGCLLTASAQDGNYQVFPLAVAVVDGENDKAWKWFFTKLSQFIPNQDDVVFVSDRHPSIYFGIAKVYPLSKHCACILHLKRNIRTYFKDKHLGYLVGKAARAFQLCDLYSAFNEIKRVNASCAEYLLGIGLEHWARAHFTGHRYNIMTSNVAETWNAVLREARESAYGAIIAPVVEQESVEILSSDTSASLVSVNPPASRRPPGRPRKNRFLSRGEFQSGGARKRTMCSRCKGTGHNRATCKMAI